jgi:hypothetical protein
MLKLIDRWSRMRRIRYVRKNRDIYIGVRNINGGRGKYDDVMTTYRYWGKLAWIGVHV